MRPVEVVLTDELALKAYFALDHLLRDEEHVVMEEDERADFQRLAVFFQEVAAQPEAFRPQGRSASRVRTVVRRAKGRAQIPSMRKKRSGRHQRRRAARMHERRNREAIEAFNQAQAAYERDREELEAMIREAEERTKDQPHFEIRDIGGNVVLRDIPAEAVYTAEGEPAFPQKKIVVAR